jgi:hypothetical protein
MERAEGLIAAAATANITSGRLRRPTERMSSKTGRLSRLEAAGQESDRASAIADSRQRRLFALSPANARRGLAWATPQGCGPVAI